ncbi:MAG TPA: AtzE family amidohydrolase, partial [Microcoleaceae cyanobacterium]
MSQYPDVTSIAESVRNREVSAKSVVAAALARIADQNQRLNCFTSVLAEQAMAEAESIDRAIAAG